MSHNLCCTAPPVPRQRPPSLPASHPLPNVPPAVITGTVKALLRREGNRITATVTLTHAYKSGLLSLPPEGTEATLRLDVPCRQCPILKKGEKAGRPLPESFLLTSGPFTLCTATQHSRAAEVPEIPAFPCSLLASTKFGEGVRPPRSLPPGHPSFLRRGQLCLHGPGGGRRNRAAAPHQLRGALPAAAAADSHQPQQATLRRPGEEEPPLRGLPLLLGSGALALQAAAATAPCNQ